MNWQIIALFRQNFCNAMSQFDLGLFLGYQTRYFAKCNSLTAWFSCTKKRNFVFQRSCLFALLGVCHLNQVNLSALRVAQSKTGTVAAQCQLALCLQVIKVSVLILLSRSYAHETKYHLGWNWLVKYENNAFLTHHRVAEGLNQG